MKYKYWGCSALTTIEIPSNVTAIKLGAFSETGLTSIDIPASVTTIGHDAFLNCSSLASVTVRATTPPQLTQYAFYGNASGRKIYVPGEVLNVYKNAEGWSDYADDIQPIGAVPYIDADGNMATALNTFFGNGASVNASFKRTFTKDVASTICLPFPITSITGGKVYQFVGVEYDNTAGWVATMKDETPDNKVTSTTANTPYLFKPGADGKVTFTGTIASVPASITAGLTTSTDNDWTFNGTYSRLTYNGDLNGRRLAEKPTTKGIYINGGHKVVIK